MARTLYAFDHEEAVTRVIGWLRQASPADAATGASWYGNAYRTADQIATATKLPIDLVATVIAHLSPQTRWADNVAHAWHILTGSEGKPVGAIGDNVARAVASITGYYGGADPLESFGPKAHKTRAFARAILGDVDSVVIDVWAARAALLPDYAFRDGSGDEVGKILRRAGVYAAVADVYTDASARTGINPCAVQAIVWGQIRGSYA